VDIDIDHRDTFAYVLFDGLSASESFFMEALYERAIPLSVRRRFGWRQVRLRNTWTTTAAASSRTTPCGFSQDRPGHSLRRVEKPEFRT
jgi:hypothetical protein